MCWISCRAGKDDQVAHNGTCEYVGPDFFGGRIEKLFAWNDENGPATELSARIADIDVVGTVATVRLELDNWTGHKFTDLFTLLKVDGEWKIINKVFHLHA